MAETLYRIECYVHARRVRQLVDELLELDRAICGMWSSKVRGIGAINYSDRMSGSRFPNRTIPMSRLTILVKEPQIRLVMTRIEGVWTPIQEEGEFILTSSVSNIAKSAVVEIS